MTRRLTISLPDDVAARLDTEPNASAYISDAIRHRMRGEQLTALFAEDGFIITPEGRARAREALDRARAKADRPEAVAARVARQQRWRTQGAGAAE